MCIKNLLLRAQNVNFLLEDLNLFPSVTISRLKNNFIFSLVARPPYHVVGKRTMVAYGFRCFSRNCFTKRTIYAVEH